MSQYQSIKDLVIDCYLSEGQMPSFEKLTSLVKQFFPMSRWQKTHYSWYKSQIKTGKISLPETSSGETEIDNIESEIESDIEDSLESRVSLERDLQNYLVGHLSDLEPGLKLYANGVEYQTDAGRIDILASDSEGRLVVIEVKAGTANDRALGQILGYTGCLHSNNKGKKDIRCILVASTFESRGIYASKQLTNLKLIKYKLAFHLEEVTCPDSAD